ncbi:hypothetical protein CLM74_06075 [Stenotrophomonas sp. MYb57]|nr:hypothetical protein CLM74_06075 [Stenotrophomonas sp. MYb57]
MKRIGVLLIVLVGVAWIGSKAVPGRDPSVAAAPSAVANAPAIQTRESEARPAGSTAPLTVAEKKAQQEKWFGAETIISAKRAVRRELEDPASAHFVDVRANYTEAFGVVACGRINAKNKFGGYSGYRRFISGGRSVILEGRDNIGDAWAGACL